MTYRITAPVAGFTGTVAGLAFADGVAEGDPSPGALGYFRRRGYRVEELRRRRAKAAKPTGEGQGDEQGDGDENKTGNSESGEDG